MNELFPEIRTVTEDLHTKSRSKEKKPFVFVNPLYNCPRKSCQSKGPYKLRVVHGEFERSCLKCGFAFIPGSPEAEAFVQKSYTEQLKIWQEGR